MNIVAELAGSSVVIGQEWKEHIYGSGKQHLLLAMCAKCKEVIYYRGNWMCDKCKKYFEPSDGLSIANYFLMDGPERRYTVDEWVARWLGIEADNVSVDISWEE